MNPWPYPPWIAHRGAGRLAPENTLAAFRLGAEHGFRMFECDVKLSADGVPFLLHDPTLERTTTGRGTAGDLSWDALSLLRAGAPGQAARTEPLPSLAGVAHWCLAHQHLLNIEIKPTPGTEQATGAAVARAAAQLWAGAPVPPLLSSFAIEALAAARDAVPDLPRALLLGRAATGWIEEALALGCIAIVCEHKQWNPSTVTQARSAGFRTLAYTVNEQEDAEHLLALGIDGIITDRIDLFSPSR